MNNVLKKSQTKHSFLLGDYREYSRPPPKNIGKTQQGFALMTAGPTCYITSPFQ